MRAWCGEAASDIAAHARCADARELDARPAGELVGAAARAACAAAVARCTALSGAAAAAARGVATDAVTPQGGPLDPESARDAVAAVVVGIGRPRRSMRARGTICSNTRLCHASVGDIPPDELEESERANSESTDRESSSESDSLQLMATSAGARSYSCDTQ